MSISYKIVLNYIKDLSVEIPDADTLVVSRKNLPNYLLDISISSKPIKKNMIEVVTKLIYYDKNKDVKKSHFEINYCTIIVLNESKPDKEDLKKLILCDLQIEIYPQLHKIFEEILKMSGFPQLKLSKKIDFIEMYNQNYS